MLLVTAAGTQPSADWRIDTFAGTWEVGDGGSATQAQLSSPVSVTVDGAGNVYIADTFNHRIRKVDPSGTITTLAGTGERGFGGDGGPATLTPLYSPSGVAADGVGNVYIADTFNHRIRKVDRPGTITTIAGTGIHGFSGDFGPAAQARLYYPNDVSVDDIGLLYIADTWNHRIRRVDPSGDILSYAYAGPDTQVKLFFPRGVAMDGVGNVYIADWNNHWIRVLTPMSGDGTEPAGPRTAPEDEQAFHLLVIGQRMLTGYPSYYVDFVSAGRFNETLSTETYTGSYSYSNTGLNTGVIVLNYDNGDRCTAQVVFTSTTAGTANITCTGGESSQINWHLTPIPVSEQAPLLEGIRDLLPF